MLRRTPAFLRAAVVLAAVVLAAAPAAADSPYFTDDGAAIRGYDPVAYFRQGAAVEGSAAHSLEWGGVTWHFASAANRQAFRERPEAYAPEYGGYCAFAAASNQLVSIDPGAWTIRDGKLYLNYSPSVQQRWERDIKGYIAQADAHWPELNPAD